MKYCFVFICQQGELEIKASLLAASLHRYLQCDHELVAAIPRPMNGGANPQTTLTLFWKRLGYGSSRLETRLTKTIRLVTRCHACRLKPALIKSSFWIATFS
jgi:hypothetical protein